MNLLSEQASNADVPNRIGLHCRICAEVLSLFLLFLASCGQAADLPSTLSGASNDCQHVSKSPPRPIQGNKNGNSEFRFTYFSDVDVEDDMRYFIYLLKNDHPKDTLPAGWPKADIQFEDIAVGKCGRNSFWTPLEHDFDRKAPVIYSHNKVEHPAEAYVRKQAPLVLQRPPSRPYRSQISAELGKDRIVRLDLRFTSAFTNQEFYCEVQNFSSTDLIVAVPQLNVRELGRPVTVRSTWRAFGDSPETYYIPRLENGFGARQTLRFSVSESELAGFSPNLLYIEVRTPDQKRLASGRISLLLPFLKR